MSRVINQSLLHQLGHMDPLSEECSQRTDELSHKRDTTLHYLWSRQGTSTSL